MEGITNWRRLWIILAGVYVLAALGLHYLSESRTFQVAGTFVPRVPVQDSVLALTLDDGPTDRYTDTVLAILREHGVRATFFLVGSYIASAPRAARAIVAAGHEVGNHSFSHQRMVFRSRSFYRTEIETTDSLIREIASTGPILFRPPYGVRLFGLPLYLRQTDRTTVLWDVEPDSDLEHDSAQIVNQVLDQVRPGSIILLHTMFPGRRESRQALRQFLPMLQARGYRFSTVSELLRLQGTGKPQARTPSQHREGAGVQQGRGPSGRAERRFIR